MTAAFLLVMQGPTGKQVWLVQGEGPSEASGACTSQGPRRRQAQGFVQEGHPAEWASWDWQDQLCHDHQQVCHDNSDYLHNAYVHLHIQSMIDSDAVCCDVSVGLVGHSILWQSMSRDPES